jgi:hypothetical protein
MVVLRRRLKPLTSFLPVILLRDVVVSVQNQGDGMLVVRLRKPGKYGPEYNVALRIPESVFQKTLFSIIRKAGITLGEVGEITI